MIRTSLSLLAMTLLLPASAAEQTTKRDPISIPQAEARRLEVLFLGAPTANHPAHDPVERYRILKKGLGLEGINLSYSESLEEALNPAFLAKFDSVLLYGNWKDISPTQEKALIDYVEAGHGFVPVHCASACFEKSAAFVKLVGGHFKCHGGEIFEVTTIAPEHPAIKGVPVLKAWDETYQHDRLAEDRNVLQVRKSKEGDEPWTWVRNQGKGRVFYTASGHDQRVWEQAAFHSLLAKGLSWSSGPEAQARLTKLAAPATRQVDLEVPLPGYRDHKAITRGQDPLSPADSAKLIQVPPGYRCSLFASEPDIVNPIFVGWDHRGRAYVIETIDYPNNLHDGNIGNDRITLCEDTDGDGRADKFTRFADKLSIPTSLVCVNGGVLCTNGGDLVFLKDTNGDGIADERKVVVSGFGTGDTHAGCSNLRYGLDGYIYGTVGYSGFKGRADGKELSFGMGPWRMKSDFSGLESLQNTTNNTWGLGFTEDFDVLGSTANGNPSWVFTLPRERYDHFGMKQPRTPVADDCPLIYPSSMDIRMVDFQDRYTAAAGHAFYNAARFPAEDRKVAYVTEPTGKLVGQFDIAARDGNLKAVQRRNNIFNSADAWTSPVCAEVGPDGAVWVCDWYNLIIQHNPQPNKASAGVDFTTGKGNAYDTPLRDKKHGRVWRVFPDGSADDAKADLDPAKPANLVAALSHSNQLWRLHAQRLIVENHLVALVPELRSLLARNDLSAVHAMWTLIGLKAASREDAAAALASTSAGLRRAGRDCAPELAPEALLACLKTCTDPRELSEVLAAISRIPASDAVAKALLDTHPALTTPALKEAWKMATRQNAREMLAISGSSVAAQTKVNLAVNGAFESGVTPDSWELKLYRGELKDIVMETVAQGRTGRALHLSAKSKADFGAGQVIKVTPGKSYRVSAWARCGKIDGAGPMLNVHGGPQSEVLRNAKDWTQLSLTFTANADTALIHCLLGSLNPASGEAWFDDLQVEETDELADTPSDLKNYLDSLGRQQVAVKAKFAPDAAVHKRGADLYLKNCAACHQPDGKGLAHGFPPLAGSSRLLGDAALPAGIVLLGLQGPVTASGQPYNNIMPAMPLKDDEIADVLTYARQNFGNDVAPVTAAQVKARREALGARKEPLTAKDLN